MTAPVTTVESYTGLPYELIHFPPAASAPVSLLVPMVPGNPGLPAYYSHFLPALLAALPRTTEAFAVGHLNHCAAARGREKQPGLSQQVDHKVAVLDQLVAERKGVKVVLIGHSIGSWICLQMIAARPNLIASHHALFPTISHMANTQNGHRMAPLFSTYLSLPLYLSNTLLSYVPRVVLTPLVGLLSGQTDPAAQAITASLVSTPTIVFSALSLAREELANVTALQTSLLQEHKNKIRFYYAKDGDDGWVSEACVEEVVRAVGPDRVVRCVEGNKHAFVLDKVKTASLARRCAGWIVEDLGLAQ